jgi:hypothetical protein
MAFQPGLPILIIREEGVLADGMLERGVAGLYMPEFNLDKPIDEYFNSVEWRGVIQKWEGYMRAILGKKGLPPQLFLARIERQRKSSLSYGAGWGRVFVRDKIVGITEDKLCGGRM